MKVLGKEHKHGAEVKQQLANPANHTLTLPFFHIGVTTVLSLTLGRQKLSQDIAAIKNYRNDEGAVINPGREQHYAPFLLAIGTNC